MATFLFKTGHQVTIFLIDSEELYYVKFSIDSDVPTLVPQEGTLGRTSDFKYSLNGNIKKDDIKRNMQSLTDTGKPASMTQSEAHMSVPSIRKEVERIYKFSKTPYYMELYDEAVTHEHQHADCFVFYNAFTNEWRVPQDLYLELHKRLHPLTINIENFRTFRWISVSHKTPKTFLKEEFSANGLVNDNEWRIKSL